MGKPFKLQNGQLLLSTEAPGGVYNSTQLRKIAELCDGDSALAKATEDQRLALFVPPENVAKVATALRSTGLGVRHYQDGLHQPVNCVGELCPEHQQDAMSAGMEIAAELAAFRLESPLKIGINGCARGCVATHTLDISILGDSNGYRISLGGKNSQIPEMAAFMADGVPSAKLPKLIAKIVSIYKEIAEPGESLQEVIERHGASKFIAALSPYSQDAQGDSSGIDGFGASEPQKLDDLGVPQYARHDGPAVDANLANVELANEPSVEGFRPEPVLEDHEEEVVSDQDLEAEAELEPIQPIDETVDESAFAEHDEIHAQDLPAVDGAEAAIETVPVHEFDQPHDDVAAIQAAASQANELDVVKLEAASQSLGDELDVKLEPVADASHDEPTLRLVQPPMDREFEEELIEDDEVGPVANHDFSAREHGEETLDADLEPEHLALDEVDLETASVDHGDMVASHVTAPSDTFGASPVHEDELRVDHAQESVVEHSEPNAEHSLTAETMQKAEDTPALSPVPDEQNVSLSVVEAAADFAADQASDHGESHEESHEDVHEELNVESHDVLHVESHAEMHSIQEAQFEPMATPDESVVPMDATPLISQPTLNSDILDSHEHDHDHDHDHDLDSVSEDIDSVEEEFIDDDMPEAVGANEIEGDEADKFEENFAAEIAEEQNIPEAEDHNRDDRQAAMQLLAVQAESTKEVRKEETKMATTNFPPRGPAEPAGQAQRPVGFEFIGLDFNADGRISLQFASGAVMAIDPWALVGASRRELRLAGKVIVLTPIDGGINVEVDGIAIFLPQKAAA